MFVTTCRPGKKCEKQFRNRLSESTSKTMSVSNRATCEYSVMRQTSPHGTWGSCLNFERSVLRTANLFMTPLHRLWITSGPQRVWQKFKSSTWSSLHSPIDSSACRPVSSVAPNRSFGSINTVIMCIGIIFVCLHTVKMACSCLPICFIEKRVHQCQGTGSESITAGIGIGSVMYVFTWFSTEGPMVLWHWDLWCAARKDTLKLVPLNHLQKLNRDTYYIDRCVKQHLSPSVCDSIAIQDFQMLRWDRRLSWSAEPNHLSVYDNTRTIKLWRIWIE